MITINKMKKEIKSNHTSLSKSKQERKPMKAPKAHHQQFVSTNPKQDLQLSVQSKSSKEP